MKKAIWSFVKIVLIGALGYYIFHDIKMSQLLPALLAYSWSWLLIAMVSVILSDLILALRWRSLSQHSCSLSASFESIVFSVFANSVLPAKLGEVAKLFYLRKLYGIRLSHGFSLMLTERFFDVLVLGVLVVISAQLYWQDPNVQVFGWIIIALIVALFFLIRSPLARRSIYWMPTTGLRRWMLRLYHHFQVVLAKESVLTLTFWSILLWLSYLFTTILFFWAVMGLDLSLSQLFIASMVAFVAFSIPLLPAGSGTFQVGVILILTQYGISKEEALIGSIVLQLIMILPSTIISLVLLQKKELSIKEFMKGDDE